VKSAILEHGYRFIDTATIYGNEDSIGNALQECFAQGIKREDLFIGTKLWQSDRDDVEGAVRKSLAMLKVDYLDLYLLHWMAPKMVWEDDEPIKNTPTHKVWAELERLVDLGLIKNLGVSNCTIPMLIDLYSYARHKPVNNQVELHPYLVQKNSVDFHKKLGVTLTAYAPLGANAWSLRDEKLKTLNVLSEPVVTELAAKHGKTPAQIVLNWHIHNRDHIVIPKTLTLSRLGENLNVYDFKLTDEEYEQISALDKKARFFDPSSMKEYGWNYCPYFE
jgi:diketogulonate reductase-like aldo/keto reductase